MDVSSTPPYSLYTYSCISAINYAYDNLRSIDLYYMSYVIKTDFSANCEDVYQIFSFSKENTYPSFCT